MHQLALEAYDLASGNLIYEVAITHWVKFTHSHIQVVQEKSLYWINLQSGHFEIPEDPTDEGSNQFLFENPSHFEENQPGFSDFKLFFKQNFDENIVKAMDCWDGNDKIIFSYYLYDNGWKNYLRVCNLAFETLVLELIAEGDAIGYHTFTLLNDQLIFVKDKIKLVIYEKL